MSKRVLIVEDDAAMRRGLCDNFRAAGFDVESAEDGQVGLAHAMVETFDLVILDIMLPRVNGFEFCRQVRESNRSTPILMLTAKSQEEDIVRGLNLGADDYLTKPFGIAELMARSQRLVMRRSFTTHSITDRTQDTIQVGDLVLDRPSRRLVLEGQPTPLTSKEFMMLECFLRNPGRTWTRTQLLDEVWGRSMLVSTRSVDRCVTTLRGKLNQGSHRDSMIQTIRGIGYRFEVPTAP